MDKNKTAILFNKKLEYVLKPTNIYGTGYCIGGGDVCAPGLDMSTREKCCDK